jgi:uncharacterized SAM-binding protein YcdF (DUF218 family)
LRGLHKAALQSLLHAGIARAGSEKNSTRIKLPGNTDMAEAPWAGIGENTIEPERKRRRWWIPAGILAVVSAPAIVLFFKVGNWLVVEDPLVHSDVIIILSGRLPERAIEAARLYQARYADQVWISPPISPAEELKEMNINYLGEDFYNEKVLLARGVPLEVIHILENPDANTEEEVRQVSSELAANNLHAAIIVTSKPHTRRVQAMWRKLIHADQRLIVRYPVDDPYDGTHWWRHTQDALDVSREVLGLLNVWAGLPIRPSLK